VAETLAEQRARYPVMAYNFRVTIGSDTIGFAEVSGLKREMEVVTYRHGFSYTEGEEISTYHINKYETITLKRGTARGFKTLHQWLEQRDTRSVDVSLCDELGQPVVTWHVAKAIPVKIEAPSFDAKASEVSIDSFTLQAAGIRVKHHA
jgi:phage tail-like protein